MGCHKELERLLIIKDPNFHHPVGKALYPWTRWYTGHPLFSDSRSFEVEPNIGRFWFEFGDNCPILLNDLFINPLNPSEEEDHLFQLDYGVSYVSAMDEIFESGEWRQPK